MPDPRGVFDCIHFDALDSVPTNLSRKSHKEGLPISGQSISPLNQESDNPRNRWPVTEGKYTHNWYVATTTVPE
jgi:hypothetical protein